MAGKAAVLKEKDIQNIFKFVKSPRDRSIIAIGIYAGLRIGEIIRLQTDQVLTENGPVRSTLVVKRLKKKDTTYSDIPVHRKLRNFIREYALTAELETWLFPSWRAKTRGHIGRIQDTTFCEKPWMR